MFLLMQLENIGPDVKVLALYLKVPECESSGPECEGPGPVVPGCESITTDVSLSSGPKNIAHCKKLMQSCSYMFENLEK